MAGTYILQGNRAAFNQHTVDATCRLCLAAPETRQHFIAECSAFAHERVVYVGKLRDSPASRVVESVDQSVYSEVFTQLTLDVSVYVTNDEDIVLLELYSREYIERIHRKRIARLR